MSKIATYSERRANEIINMFEIRYPIDLYSLCKQIDIEIIDYYKLQVDGYLYRDVNCKLIFVDKKIKNDGKKRFVIAHELGHYFLHSKELMQICSEVSEIFNRQKSISLHEKEANQFSAELLAPTNLVSKELPNRALNFKIIQQLAEKFDVSITSMAIKCVKNSKTEGETLFCLKNNSIYWCVNSDDEIDYRLIPSSAPYGSLAYEIVEGINDGAKKRVNSGVWRLYRGEVVEEVFMISTDTYLILLNGIRNSW